MLKRILEAPSLWQIDLDGTLVDSQDIHTATAEQVIRKLLRKGLECTVEEAEATRILSRTPVTRVVHELFNDGISPEEARRLYQDTYKGQNMPVEAFRKAGDVLKFLKQHNQLVAIITGGNKEVVEANIDAIRAQSPEIDIDGLFYDREGIPVKPDPATCNYIIASLKGKHPEVDFRRRVVIGDSEIDLRYAKNSGSEFIYVAGQNPDQKIQEHSNLIVLNMEDFYRKLIENAPTN